MVFRRSCCECSLTELWNELTDEDAGEQSSQSRQRSRRSQDRGLVAQVLTRRRGPSRECRKRSRRRNHRRRRRQHERAGPKALGPKEQVPRSEHGPEDLLRAREQPRRRLSWDLEQVDWPARGREVSARHRDRRRFRRERRWQSDRCKFSRPLLTLYAG